MVHGDGDGTGDNVDAVAVGQASNLPAHGPPQFRRNPHSMRTFAAVANATAQCAHRRLILVTRWWSEAP